MEWLIESVKRLMKYLFRFKKSESIRWLGHLDILRAFERAIRRSSLPVAFTLGFNPREKLAFASALGVGATASDEKGTVELTEHIPPVELLTRLNENLPPGLQILETREIADQGSRDLLNRYRLAHIEMTCDCSELTTLEEAQLAADHLMVKECLSVKRHKEGAKDREFNARTAIRQLQAVNLENHRLIFSLHLLLLQEGSVKPAEVVQLLQNEIPGLKLRRIHRRDLAEYNENIEISS